MRGVVQTPWTDEERAMLRRLRQNGLGTVKISVMMGRSKGSIQRQMRYLGLATACSERSVAGNAPRPSQPPKPRHEGPQRAGASTLPLLPSLRD